MKSNSLLIFGGTGFVGQSILKYFLSNNFIKKFDKLFIVEDHFQDGGFQSWLNESLNKKNCKTKLESKSLSFVIMNKVGSKDYLMNYLR